MNRTLGLGCVAAVLCGVSLARAQITIGTLDTAITENFNSIGTTASASLPTGWAMTGAGDTSVSWADGTNVATVSQQSSSGSPTTGGRYNWGNGTATTDRAIGFMTSGGYASPNGILAYYENSTGSLLTDVTISFDVERYRTNTAAASVSFFTSTDGSTWTARTSGNIAAGVFATGANSYNFSSGDVIARSVSITGLAIADGGSFYLRWSFDTAGSNSQGLGLDNVSFTASAIPEPSTYALVFGGLALVGAAVQRKRRAAI